VKNFGWPKSIDGLIQNTTVYWEVLELCKVVLTWGAYFEKDTICPWLLSVTLYLLPFTMGLAALLGLQVLVTCTQLVAYFLCCSLL
jgi:hypothetical protein